VSDFADMMTQTVTYQTQAGHDSAGDPSWSAQSTAAARVERRHEKILATDDEEILVTHRVATYTAIPEGARVWLPGADTSSIEASVIARRVDVAPDLETGAELREVRCG